jgi:hypothetical protein
LKIHLMPILLRPVSLRNRVRWLEFIPHGIDPFVSIWSIEGIRRVGGASSGYRA